MGGFSLRIYYRLPTAAPPSSLAFTFSSLQGPEKALKFPISPHESLQRPCRGRPRCQWMLAPGVSQEEAHAVIPRPRGSLGSQPVWGSPGPDACHRCRHCSFDHDRGSDLGETEAYDAHGVAPVLACFTVRASYLIRGEGNAVGAVSARPCSVRPHVATRGGGRLPR